MENIVWVQEEPENMGALEHILKRLLNKEVRWDVISAGIQVQVLHQVLLKF